ncbi:hypothetical protein [Roseibium sp.]|uniref:hypothetical protein n=1 Tax=Roseibium sp. TaxID=1936156 RepID=UPI003B505396
MDRNPPSARRQIFVNLGELHCPRIPKKAVKLWHLGKFGAREQQSVSLDIPAQGYFPFTKTPPDRHAVCFFDPKNCDKSAYLIENTPAEPPCLALLCPMAQI